MRIFLLHYYLKKANPAYTEIAAALRRRGHDVWIGAPDADFNLAWNDGHQTQEIIPGPDFRRSSSTYQPAQIQSAAFIRRIQAFLRQNRPDIVQVNPAALQGVGLLPLNMPDDIRFVVDWRQIAWPSKESILSGAKQTAKHRWRMHFSRHHFQRATFLHEAGANVFLGQNWERWGTVVPLGVGTQFLADASGNQASEQNADRTEFLYIGSLSRVRQLECLITAAAVLRAKTDRFVLRFVGPDNANGYYHALIQERDLTDVVDISAPVSYEEIPATVRRHHVAVAYVPLEPADWQYHPTLKVLEYRALGVPMIGTDVAPNRDVVQPHINGLLTPNTPEDWAEAMGQFVENTELLRRTTQQAQQMRIGHSWADIAAQYESAVYRPLLERVRYHRMPDVSENR